MSRPAPGPWGGEGLRVTGWLLLPAGSNSFLQKVHRTMTSKLLHLPDKHSLTELLNAWAHSVQQACRSAA